MIIKYYLWIKAFHVISVVAWMAGLFYLPRLFVYHVESPNLETRKTLAIMELRLYRIIMVPAMTSAIFWGGILLLNPSYSFTLNTAVKMVCVFSLVVFQFYLNNCRWKLSRGINQKTSRFFRLLNEIPTLLLIVIVICVIVKPFP